MPAPPDAFERSRRKAFRLSAHPGLVDGSPLKRGLTWIAWFDGSAPSLPQCPGRPLPTPGGYSHPARPGLRPASSILLLMLPPTGLNPLTASRSAGVSRACLRIILSDMVIFNVSDSPGGSGPRFRGTPPRKACPKASYSNARGSTEPSSNRSTVISTCMALMRHRGHPLLTTNGDWGSARTVHGTVRCGSDLVPVRPDLGEGPPLTMAWCDDLAL